MCDWGGGPNEIQNYLPNNETPKKVRTIECMKYVPLPIGRKCGMPIEGFSGSITYWEWDEAARKHIEEVHSTRR